MTCLQSHVATLCAVRPPPIISTLVQMPASRTPTRSARSPETRSPRKGKSTGTATPRQRGRIQTIPKEILAKEIRTIIQYRHLNQAQAAEIVGDAQSQLSLVLSGKLDGFSSDRLLQMLLRLGRNVDIIIKPTGGLRRQGKLRVMLE